MYYFHAEKQKIETSAVGAATVRAARAARVRALEARVAVAAVVAQERTVSSYDYLSDLPLAG